jgi:hypothetical protein
MEKPTNKKAKHSNKKCNVISPRSFLPNNTFSGGGLAFGEFGFQLLALLM